MRLRPLVRLCIIAQFLVPVGWGQQPAADGPKAAKATAPSAAEKDNKVSVAVAPRRLHKESAKPTSEIAESFGLPLVCDGDENLYLRTAPDGIQAVHKLSSQGKRVALFQPNSADVKVNAGGSFAVAQNGDFYQLIFAHEITRYVFVYNKDGGVKSEIKLQPGFAFSPSKIAVFPSGDLLVSGLEYDKDRNNHVMWPFTGIFSSDGTLRRELSLKDDESIHDMAAAGDPRVAPPESPYLNYAVERGEAETAADGNVYLMRRLSPAIFYAISPGGSVRRFEVSPDREDFVPESMHISGNRIAIMFWQPQTYEMIIKVVDLKGHPFAAYYEPAPKEGEQRLGLGFACYAQNPEHFTFLETMEDNKLGFITATPE
jgi:hypothetical protein